MAQRRAPPATTTSGYFRLLRRLFSETGRKYAGSYALALSLMAVVGATGGITAWMVGDVVDRIFVDRDQRMLLLLAGAVVVVFVTRGLSNYGASVVMARIGNTIVASMQRRIYDHMLSLGLDFYDGVHSSELITRMTQGANAVRSTLDTIITSFGRDLISVVALVLVMVIQSPTLSLIVLATAPVAIIATMGIVRRIRNVARGEFRSSSLVIKSMQETAHGIRIVKAMNLESKMRDRMGEAIEGVRKRNDTMAEMKARTGPIMETLGGAAVAGVMLCAGYATIYLGEKPGAFMSFITAILLAYEPAKRLARTHVNITTSLVGVRMMYDLLDTRPTMDVRRGGPELRLTRGEVCFDAVDFGYGGDALLFSKLSLKAEGGRMTALVGASGGGKSTLMSLILRFYDPISGRVTIDGQDISEVDITSLRRCIGFVSQEIVLFNGTLRENIRFGRPDATDEEIERAARDALAHDFIMAMPLGYDTAIGDRNAPLSGGQRQRIAIARAMLQGAPIILLDEATSALDSESEHYVQLAFERLMRNRTTIVIAHRLSTVQAADKIIVMAKGQVVEEGRHADLLKADRYYAMLYRSQFKDQAVDLAGKADAASRSAASSAAALSR